MKKEEEKFSISDVISNMLCALSIMWIVLCCIFSWKNPTANPMMTIKEFKSVIKCEAMDCYQKNTN